MEIEVDVLVVGAGASGINAAVHASRGGAKVLLAAKSGLRNNITNWAKGGFSACMSKDDTPDLFLEDTLRAGEGMNRIRVCRQMCKGSHRTASDLLDWGFAPVPDPQGGIDLKHTIGHRKPRIIHCKDRTGFHLMTALLSKLKKSSISIVKDLMILDLIRDAEGVKGGYGIFWRTGRTVLIRADVCILATGGAGHAYEFTDNPISSTGDGFALAFRSGAGLIDMEMIDFQLAIAAPSKIRGRPANTTGFFFSGAKIYNTIGERPLKRYYPETMEKSSRAEINRTFGLEAEAGRTTESGGLYLDCSDVLGAVQSRIPGVCSIVAKAGLDLASQPLEVAPAAHTFLGGILIDPEAFTSIPGLMAAGETAGGIHGANRLGGNALTDALVFGARAGEFAAKKAKETRSRQRITGFMPQWIREISERKEGILPAELRKSIQKKMSRHAFIIRGKEGLVKAKQEMEDLRKDLFLHAATGAGTREKFYNLRRHVENLNLIDTGLMVLTGAIHRNESRGVHYRKDAACRIEAYTGNFIQYFENSRHRIDFHPAECDRQ